MDCLRDFLFEEGSTLCDFILYCQTRCNKKAALSGFFERFDPKPRLRLSAFHRGEEFFVGLSHRQFIDQEFHCADFIHWI